MIRKKGKMELAEWLAAPFVVGIKAAPISYNVVSDAKQSANADIIVEQSQSLKKPEEVTFSQPPTNVPSSVHEKGYLLNEVQQEEQEQANSPTALATNLTDSQHSSCENPSSDVLFELQAENIKYLETCLKAAQEEMKNEKVRRYERKLSDTTDGSTKIKELKDRLKEKNEKIAELEAMTDDIIESEQAFLHTFENGHYRNDIRVTVYELLSMGVGSKKVSKIIRTVLERVAKMKVDRLPKSSIIKYMATEQGMLAKHRAYDAIDTSEDAITLHTDGTSKKGQHFLTYLASTSSGTYALSLDDIHSETSDVMVTQAEEALKGLTNLLL
ncbi:hypothetical protein HOLleu_10237 [Holothuria leucospilota]|uniref:Uncharacterized protein n=1 Tax=Holothuria leucospilota TaxID=206669 RepID=A0A9Q1CEL6_HOLLE|nr:hypothetical protein HOLleu_10237 [Holothuria leucospilota]